MGSTDILVALKIAAGQDQPFSARSLARDLGISKSATASSLGQLRRAGLVVGGRLSRISLQELLVHGARYIFPPQVGGWVLGLPTAYSYEEIAGQLTPGGDPLVMPLAEGPQRGRSLSPIHPRAPQAAARDPHLHRLLALVDTLRIGRARERAIAARGLKTWLDGAQPS